MGMEHIWRRPDYEALFDPAPIWWAPRGEWHPGRVATAPPGSQCRWRANACRSRALATATRDDVVNGDGIVLTMGKRYGDADHGSRAGGAAAGRVPYRKVRERASFAFANVSLAAVLDPPTRTCHLALGGVAHALWRCFIAERRLRDLPAATNSVRIAADEELAERLLRGALDARSGLTTLNLETENEIAESFRGFQANPDDGNGGLS